MIRYQPDKLLKKIMPEHRIKKMMSKDVTVKKSAFRFLDESDIIDKKNVVDVALKTIKSYNERINLDNEVKDEILSDPAQLIQRVQNEVVFQVSNLIQDKYEGTKYRWLPSEADEPDPEHQLNYGEVFVIGEQEDPGQRYGCQCGMEIFTDDEKLEL